MPPASFPRSFKTCQRVREDSIEMIQDPERNSTEETQGSTRHSSLSKGKRFGFERRRKFQDEQDRFGWGEKQGWDWWSREHHVYQDDA